MALRSEPSRNSRDHAPPPVAQSRLVASVVAKPRIECAMRRRSGLRSSDGVYDFAMRGAADLGRRVLSVPQRLQLVLLDYRLHPERRQRNAHLLERVEQSRPRIAESISGMVGHEPFFAEISSAP